MENIKLPKKFLDILENFTDRLKTIYKEGLVSVVLYGSAASGEFMPRYSNINLLVILTDTGLDNLRKVAPVLNTNRFRILNVLFFTEGYMRDSADVFPVEFLDMKENNVVLYGKDIMRDLNIDIKNLRLQCEQEMKAKLIIIKKLYLGNTNKAALKGLLFRSFTSSLHVLRNMIRLKGRHPSYRKEDILKELSAEFQIDTSAFRSILEAKAGNIKLSYGETNSLFLKFVADLEKLTKIVNHL